MFLLFGYGKLTGYAGTVAYMGSLGLPVPSLFSLLAIIIEIGGGLLILVGYQTRLVSLGLAIYVLVAAFIGHSQLGDPNQFQHFMKNMAIVGGLLAFVAFGGGAYSLNVRFFFQAEDGIRDLHGRRRLRWHFDGRTQLCNAAHGA